MATTIKLKNGSGAPLASDLVQGEPAFDLTNKRLYTEDSGGTVIEVGTTPTSLTTTGTVTFGSLSDGAITITAFVDEDNMVSDSATLVPTQQSVKAYVDSQVTAQDLDFQGDSGGALSIDLDSETLTIAGGTGIDTTGATNTLTVAIDSTVTTLTGTQTLTNKTLTAPVISTISNTGTLTLPTSTDTLVGRATTDTLTNKTLTSPVINTGVSGTAVLDDDTFATASATTLATSESIKAYVDSQVASADTLAELTDTNITTPADGALLFYDTTTTKWIDNVVSGDITIADTGVAAISSGVIVNDDVNASAAISVSKTALTAGTGLTLTTDTLSVDASQTQITAVGTIGTGTWQGTAIADAYVADNLTISGGTVDNTVIGGTTAAAGTFTTFTSTGIDDNATSTAITISSSEYLGIGTTTPEVLTHLKSADNTIFQLESTDANVYMKMVDSNTTGAGYIGYETNDMTFWANNAERVRINSSGNVGIGTTSPDTELHVEDATGNAVVQIEASATGFSGVFFGDVNDGDVGQIRYDHADNSMRFGTNTIAERMRIDSAGNVGIGTTSPDAPLHIQTASGSKSEINLGQTAVTNYRISIPASTDALTFVYGASTERMRIDSSGNVGVGTTSINARLNVVATSGEVFRADASGGAYRIVANQTGVNMNGNVGIGTTSPSHKLEVVGRIQTDTLAVDTAGGTDSGFLGGRSDWTGGATDNSFTIGSYQPNLCFFTNNNGTTERMRIDSSGNVGIGTTGPASKLEISGTGTGAWVTLDRQDSGTNLVDFTQSGTRLGYIGYSANNLYLNNATASNTIFNTSNTERMRIDSSGNVGIGTSSPATKLDIQQNTGDVILRMKETGSGQVQIRAVDSGVSNQGNMSFHTESSGGTAERMRIDSSGNLLVGKTSATLSASGMMVIAGNSMTLTIASGTTYHLHDGSNYKFYVNANGGIYNYQANDVNLSDQRVKKDIVDSSNYLEKLCNIPVRNFRYNEDAEDGKHHLGVIAQEVEAVAPEFVNKASWEHKDGQMDTVYNTDLMFAMMKSIQELSAQVNELKAEVAALKGA